MQHVFTFTLAFLIVYALVPVMRNLALKTGFVDVPNQRKIHRDPIPLLGGAAMFVGFFATTMVMGEINREYIGLALGALVIFLVGLVDDYAKTRGKDFPALPKFVGQLLAATVLISFDIRIEGITVPFGSGAGYYEFDTWLSVVGTLLWVVGITNMFNFLDGVDGLAGGIAAISATTLLFISLLKGQTTSAMFAVTLIAISLAFLRHNFHPAQIFMGDSGATFLGFTLAAIAVEGAFKAATLVSVAVPVLALGVPIFDFFYVTIKRIKEHRPIHKADKAHTFHQLMRSGMNQIQTVAFLYLLGICFSLASIIVVLVNR
ncbi:MraY family glycosyltransferase [Effusibacillus lacus]|uniref:Undecaprenyl-phosphate alpha-N-acetylglucosaminyl 1-phosphate transferase n=1 Tax=Effusibacillus lacus TaxID=1348429 RepID=A0A292YQF7_9BACL|nr:MraY family glycosyltransferase [Effusibacillus lacus]TCS76808.1 UDP-GlcNAc:undecaprenyl-phosphate GlcNAc-1-phosphate transferase [Effusibacillus lacus]GAX91139.1 undecaprenyl-phosphate alpha-N-acetylglucosaminyl 1-phosphate transferase [Effusibacillus lacus]